MASHIASTPNGTLIANSQCQDATDRIAAATDGPDAEDVATTRAMKPMPRPSWERGNTKRISAPLTLMMPAAPRPCTMRAVTSIGSEADSAQINEAAVNTASPMP